MEWIYKKLLTGDNNFKITIDGQERLGTILQLDLERSRAFVKLNDPIKRMVTVFEPAPFAYEPDETIAVKKETLICEDWLTITPPVDNDFEGNSNSDFVKNLEVNYETVTGE